MAYVHKDKPGLRDGAREQFALLDKFEQWMGLPPETMRGYGWQAHSIMRSGEVVGLGVTRGTEIHFACHPEWRGSLLRRSTIRRFLEPLFNERGYLTTRQVLPADPEARRFLDRLGFALTSSDDNFDYFMLSELPYGED